jgi:hypothetical protein
MGGDGSVLVEIREDVLASNDDARGGRALSVSVGEVAATSLTAGLTLPG